jgi:uncharacterized membrane protein (DUF4010 family)
MDISFLQGSGLALGLLIGLERERNPSAKAGLRTFALVAMFGTLAALLSTKLDTPWLLIAGLLTVAIMIIAAYLNDPGIDTDPGTTTVIALLMSYGLGAMIWYGLAKLAVMLGIGITALLYFKPELRGLSQRMTRRDLVSILQFSALTFVILPILPNQNYGPYAAFNPYQAWMMVVLISGMSLAGYVALHWADQRYGVPLLGFLGGLVSSTATTLLYARQSKVSVSMVRLSAVIILIASQVVLIRLIVISVIVSPALLRHILPVMGLGLLFGIISTLFNWNKLRSDGELPMPETSNPTEIHAALSFGLLYGVVLLCSAWLNDIAGSSGLYVVALISGITDVDPVALSSLRLFSLDKLGSSEAVTAIAIAFISNMAFKFGIVAFIGGKQLAKHVATGFAAIATGVALGLFFL